MRQECDEVDAKLGVVADTSKQRASGALKSICGHVIFVTPVTFFKRPIFTPLYG